MDIVAHQLFLLLPHQLYGTNNIIRHTKTSSILTLTTSAPKLTCAASLENVGGIYSSFSTIFLNISFRFLSKNGASPYNATQHNTIQYNMIQQHNTIQYNTIQYNTTQHDSTMQYKFTQYNKIQWIQFNTNSKQIQQNIALQWKIQKKSSLTLIISYKSTPKLHQSTALSYFWSLNTSGAT